MQSTLSQISKFFLLVSYFNWSFDPNSWNPNQSSPRNRLNQIWFQLTCSKSYWFNQKLFENGQNILKFDLFGLFWWILSFLIYWSTFSWSFNQLFQSFNQNQLEFNWKEINAIQYNVIWFQHCICNCHLIDVQFRWNPISNCQRFD